MTQVTELLNQLKMQLASPQSIQTIDKSGDSSNDSRTNIPSVTIKHNAACSVSEAQSRSEMNDKSFLGNDDKDKQIEMLSNKLIESDKRATEMKEEIERLRDLIKQRNG